MMITILIIPLVLIIALLLALIKKKDAYAAFCDGALEGLKLVKEIIPSVVAMICLVTIIKSCGIIDDFASFIGRKIDNSKFISEITPMIFFVQLVEVHR